MSPAEHLARLAEGDEAANETLLELAAAGQLAFPEELPPGLVERLGREFVAHPLLLRMGLYFCLKALGPRGQPALPGLLVALADPRNDCRIQAAELIAGLGPAAAEAEGELLEALVDEGREDTRELVAEALAGLETNLDELERHPSPYVREGASLVKKKRSSA